MKITNPKSDRFNTSTRGFQALADGKKPFDSWTHQDLKKNVIYYKLHSISSPAITFDALDDIPTHILAKKILITKEWHHCNYIPCRFYEINAVAIREMTMADIRDMKLEAKEETERLNKQKWTRFIVYRWGISQKKHQFFESRIIYGILHKNMAFLSNGNIWKIQKDSCEIDKVFKKAPTGRKKEFDRIRRIIRNYEISTLKLTYDGQMAREVM